MERTRGQVRSHQSSCECVRVWTCCNLPLLTVNLRACGTALCDAVTGLITALLRTRVCVCVCPLRAGGRVEWEPLSEMDSRKWRQEIWTRPLCSMEQAITPFIRLSRLPEGDTHTHSIRSFTLVKRRVIIMGFMPLWLTLIYLSSRKPATFIKTRQMGLLTIAIRQVFNG